MNFQTDELVCALITLAVIFIPWSIFRIVFKSIKKRKYEKGKKELVAKLMTGRVYGKKRYEKVRPYFQAQKEVRQTRKELFRENLLSEEKKL